MTQAEMVADLRAMLHREGTGRTLEAFKRALEGEAGRDEARMTPVYKAVIDAVETAAFAARQGEL